MHSNASRDSARDRAHAGLHMSQCKASRDIPEIVLTLEYIGADFARHKEHQIDEPTYMATCITLYRKRLHTSTPLDKIQLIALYSTCIERIA